MINWKFWKVRRYWNRNIWFVIKIMHVECYLENAIHVVPNSCVNYWSIWGITNTLRAIYHYTTCLLVATHDNVIKWKHLPRCCPFVQGIHRSPVNAPHKGHWRGAFMFSVIYAWTQSWVNNRGAGDFRRNRAHYDTAVLPIIWLHDPSTSCGHTRIMNIACGMLAGSIDFPTNWQIADRKDGWHVLYI